MVVMLLQALSSILKRHKTYVSIVVRGSKLSCLEDLGRNICEMVPTRVAKNVDASARLPYLSLSL